MHELLAQLETYLRTAWRYRWAGLAAAAVICLVGWVAVLLMPNKYEVSAKVFLDTSSLLRPVLRGLAVETSARQEAILMVRRTLLTRPNLEAVARTADMDLKAKTPEEMEGVVEGLAKTVKIGGTQRDNIFEIAYENADPQLATRVVEALLNLMVERSLGMSRKDTTKTREFIDQQIKEYEARLVAAENRVKEFRQANMGLMPSDGSGYYERREAVRAQIREAELQLQETERRAESLRRQIEGDEPTFGLGPPTAQAVEVSTPVDGRIKILEEKLDQLLLSYTERHPDVSSTRRLLADLRKEREVEAARLRPINPATGEYRVNENPVYQQLKIALGAADAETAALKARVEEYRKRETELARLVNTVPQVEAELARLNRDYDVQQQNYQELVKRRESLAMSDQASKTAEDVQFNVVDPPRVPLKPTSPNRPALLGVVLALGLGSGGGLAWLVGMIRPAIYSRDGFRGLTELPVLGSVTRVSTAEEDHQHRMRILLFLGGFVGLLLAYGAVLMSEERIVSILAHLR